jgi:hypothetical protein
MSVLKYSIYAKFEKLNFDVLLGRPKYWFWASQTSGRSFILLWESRRHINLPSRTITNGHVFPCAGASEEFPKSPLAIRHNHACVLVSPSEVMVAGGINYGIQTAGLSTVAILDMRSAPFL